MAGLLQGGDGVHGAEAGAHDAHGVIPRDRACQFGDGVGAVEIAWRAFQMRKGLRRQVAVAQHRIAGMPRRPLVRIHADGAIGQRRDALHPALYMQQCHAQRWRQLAATRMNGAHISAE
ncbi:hypothetical protein G6F31_021504 [Rhizopus arrhizus]|nr:hypothetical protein G6F31_021504 [Rhizopus arrhizus]KAG0913731.1 hypothetical protein G6F32_016642 [Rhizopus arrhizus]